MNAVNRQGTLNGGCQTSLVDSVGSLVVATHGLFKTGVSTDISTTFCKPIPYNEPVDIFGYIASIGKTMAYTKVEFCHPDTGKLLAYGSESNYISFIMKIFIIIFIFVGHTKYIANSINSKVNKNILHSTFISLNN